jgi:hypothetical protein
MIVNIINCSISRHLFPQIKFHFILFRVYIYISHSLLFSNTFTVYTKERKKKQTNQNNVKMQEKKNNNNKMFYKQEC